MKTIMITGAGGTPSTNFVRSLRSSSDNFHIIGLDSNKYYLHRAETDEKYLIPEAGSDNYIRILQKLIEETSPDLLYMQPDQEIYAVSKHRNILSTNVFLPSHETIEICQNKFSSYDKWNNVGIKVPKNIIMHNRDDLKKAFKEFGSTIWIREIISPGGGKGSFKATNYKIAEAWIDYYNGWDNFVAAECLTEDTVTWQSIWKDGQLIVTQGRKRLYWEFANRSPSGVTGLTGTGITIADTTIDELAQRSIQAIDSSPNGIFSVDFTYDQEGVPNPTEINIGRFFTTHLFFTEAGINMPEIFVRLAFNEDVGFQTPLINPLPNDLLWIRGLDFYPLLTSKNTINQYELDLKKRLST